MRRVYGRSVLMVVFALVAAACGGDAAPTTTTVPTTTTTAPTTTSSTEPTTTTTTTTLPPSGPPIASEGDKNDTVAAVQFLLECGGYADLTVDGSFGPATKTAVQAAQSDLGLNPTGVVDEDTFASLSRGCADPRPLDPDAEGAVGYATRDDPETFLIDLPFDRSLTITVDPSEAMAIAVLGPNGAPIEPDAETGAFPIGTTGEHQIVITPDLEPVLFTMTLELGDDATGIADWQLTTTGITYRGTKLAIGAPADATISKIFEFLGHGVRGGGEFDTGWNAPGQEGIRGISIEGFRFLFFGPNAENPGRAKTLVRIRVLAPTTDKDGNPRPAFYVTTPQGVGPGHTLAFLKSIYPGVSSGKNSDGEYYFRLTNSGGELCFYFGTTQPTDTSILLEMSTQCRA